VLFQRVQFPDGEWLAFNPAKPFYQSSPRGEDHARVRFEGQLHPVYPLTLYRKELRCATNLLTALDGPPPQLAPKSVTLWWHRYPYKRIWLYGAGSVLGALVGIFLWRGWNADRRRRAQEAFSRQLLKSQEAERKRIAAELHDSLGQNLLIIKNQLYLTQQRVAGGSSANELEEISQAVSQTINEVREISHNLRPYQLDRLGLSKAVQAVVKKVAGSASVRIESELASIDGLFSAEGEIHFYRIVQECLNNILKHSDAATARIVILNVGGRVTIKIEDDGRGFDYRNTMNDNEHRRGFGLTGLNERVRILNGHFHCDSSPGHGTRLTFDIPIPANEKGNNDPDGG
jgi:signal transduction histidine kinase